MTQVSIACTPNAISAARRSSCWVFEAVLRGTLFSILSIIVIGSLGAKGNHKEDTQDATSPKGWTIGNGDGLVCSQVYMAYQDRLGFIWFATDNGAYKYDGVQFEHFSVRNGLSDNEVFFTYEDLGGRLWFLTFSGIPSFYHKGIIHNPENTSFLRKIRPGNFLLSFLALDANRILLGTKNGIIYLVDAEKKAAHEIFRSPALSIFSMSFTRRGEFEIYRSTNILSTYRNGKFENFKCSREPFRFPPRVLKMRDRRTCVGNGNRLFLFGEDHNASSIGYDTLYPEYAILNIQQSSRGNIWISTTKGALRTDSTFSNWKIYCDGKYTTSVLEDTEGGLWFTHQGHVTYLPKTLISGIELFENESNPGATTLVRDQSGRIIWGGNSASIQELSVASSTTREVAQLPINLNQECRINNIEVLKSGYLVSSSMGVFLIRNGLTRLTKLSGRETITLENGQTCFCHTFGLDGANIEDSTSWSPSALSARRKQASFRCFDIEYAADSTLFIASSLGLYRMNKLGESELVLAEDSFNGMRLTTLANDSLGGLWIGTISGDIYHYNSGDLSQLTLEPTRDFSVTKIRLLSKSHLAVATTNGVAFVAISPDCKNILAVRWLEASNGLPGPRIYDIVVAEGHVIVAGEKGIARFPSSFIDSRPTSPRTRILETSINSKEYFSESDFVLPYDSNFWSFGFVGIAFEGMGQIEYRYRLSGLAEEWIVTTRDFAEFPNLPPGNYTFEVDSRVANGNWSGFPAKVGFEILAPFWRRPLFWILAPIVVLSIVIVLLSIRIRTIQQKNIIERRAFQAEQRLLAAQMNPHFIFNSLNSIQRFMLQGDKLKSNEYLSDFGNLIRMMLDHSRLPEITLQEEIDFLRTYIMIESLRCNDRFTTKIEVQNEITLSSTYLPPMLVQPFVENAIWHGLSKIESGGILSLRYELADPFLVCIVEDNGSGRPKEKSDELADPNRPARKSHALEIVNDRILLLNSIKSKTSPQYSVEIEDLIDVSGKPRGTRIKVFMPLEVRTPTS